MAESEGYVIPIVYHVVNADALSQGLALIERLESKAASAAKNMDDAAKKSEAASKKTKGKGSDETSNRYIYQLKDQSKNIKGLSEFGSDGFSSLLAMNREVATALSQFNAMKKVVNDLAAAQGRYAALQNKGVENDVLDTKFYKTAVDLRERRLGVQVRETKAIQDATKVVLEEEAAEKLRNTALQTTLGLRQKLEEAKQRRANQGLVEDIMKETAALDEATVSTRVLISLQRQLAEAKARLANKDLVEAIMRETAALKDATAATKQQLDTKTRLEQQLAEAKAKSANKALVEDIMKEKAALDAATTSTRVQIDLQQKLADAKARSANKALVEEIMKEKAALDAATASARVYADVATRRAEVAAKKGALSEVTALIQEEGALKVLTAATEQLVAVKVKLAQAQARTTPQYQQEQAELQKLTREEMVRAETAKLIDKLYRDRASVLAYSSQAYKDEAASLQKLTMEERVAAETAKQLERAQMLLAKATAATNPEVLRLTKELKKLEEQQRKATTAGTHWSKHIVGLNQLTASFRAALSGVGMGFGIYTSATILAASATYGLISAVKNVIAVGAEFSKELSIVNAAMNLTVDQYHALEQASIELSATSRYSATQVVQAFREMGMSGFEYQEAMEGISSVLTLASIGMMGFGQASDIATNVLYGFGLEASDLSRVVDVMAQAVTDSAQTVEQLGTTMSYVAPVAESFGISLEMVTAASEVLVNAGIKSSRAGTGLRRVFTALFSDSENVKAQLAELGVTVNSLAGDMDAELIRVLKEVYAATNGATTGVGNLTKAIGLYGIPSFLAMVKAAGEGANSLEEIAEGLRNAGGAAYEMKKRIEENLAIDFEKLKAAISSVQERIFLLFGDSLREATQALTAFIRGFSADDAAIKNFLDTLDDLVDLFSLLALGALLGGVVLGLGKFIKGINEARKAVKGLTEATAKMGAVFDVVASKSLLGLALKITAVVGSLFLAYDAYSTLSGVVSETSEDTLSLARAQQVLNEEMQGMQVEGAAEGWAVRAKEIKQSQIELEKQLKKVNQEWETYNELALEAAVSGVGSIDAYIRKLEELSEQQDTLNASIKQTAQNFNEAMADLLDAQIRAVENREIELNFKLAINTAELQAVEEMLKRSAEEINKAKSDRVMGIGGLFAIGNYNDYSALADFLADTNPQLAELLKKQVELTNNQRQLNLELQAANTTGSTHISVLRDMAAGYRETGEAVDSLVLSSKGLKSLNSSVELLRQIDTLGESVAEANRVASMTTEQQLRYYGAKIATFRGQVEELRNTAANIAVLETKIERLKDKQAKVGLEPPEEDKLKQLRTELEAGHKLQMDVQAGLGEYEENMKEFNKLTAKGTEEMVKLQQRLVDLLNTPFEGDYVDTLKGEVDFLLAQADALTAQVNATREAFVEMRAAAVDSSDSVLSGMTDELEIISALEAKYGLVRDMLKTVYRKESGFGKTAGLNYDKVQGDIPTRILGPFQVSKDILDRAAKAGYDTSTFLGHAAAAAMELADARQRGLDIEKQFMQYFGGANQDNWKGKTKAYGADAMRILREYNPELEKAVANETALAKSSTVLAQAKSELTQDTAQLTQVQEQEIDSWLAEIKAIDMNRRAYAQQSVTVEDFIALQKEEMNMRAGALKTEKEFKALLERTNNGRSATEQELDELEKLKKLREDQVALANQLYEKEGEVYEELIMQGKAMQGTYDYSQRKLQALSDGYDSVKTRSRAYLLAMEQIRQLEEKGYLTHTEAALERINASLASLHPLTKDFAAEMTNALKILVVEGGSGKEVMADLRKSLVDMTMERYVVKITTKLIGSVMDPIIRSFESVAMTLLYGFGQMLMNSVAGLFGANSTAAGTGAGGVGGLGNLFSLQGLKDMFGGSSIGSSVANGIAKLGLGTTIGEAAGYEITSAMKPWLSGIANMPNWALGAGSLLGGLASNAIFKGQGYSGIGSNIGGLAGGLGGSAAAGAFLTPALAAGPAGWAIAAIGSILGSIAGGGIGSLFGAKEPRYGTLAGMTGGVPYGLEDWQNGPANYTKGAFGLTFGLTDKGSKNMKGSEFKEVYDALAQVTNTLAEFFGKDMSDFITEELKKMSTFGDGLLHLTENEQDIGGAIATLVETIAQAAGKSGEELGIAFAGMVGDLHGSVEEVGAQIQSAMAAAALAVELSAKPGERISQMMGLTGEIETDVARLKSLIDQFAQSGETSGETLTRLVAQLGMLDFASKKTATSLAGLSTTALIELSDALVEAFGTIEEATQATAFFYDQFTSEAEKAVDKINLAAIAVKTGLSDLITGMDKLLGESDLALLKEQLNGPLMQSREGFMELIKSLGLTTEAGRKLYAELVKLAPQFDVLFDGVEAFTDWLMGTSDVEKATREMEMVFGKWEMTLPKTRSDLEQLYLSGKLTAEQMAILAAHLDALSILFGDLDTAIPPDTTKTYSQKLQDALSDLERSVDAEKKRIDEVYAARLESLQAEKDQINSAYESRIKAINAERDALSASHDAAMERYSKQRDAAQEALSAASSVLSTIQQALSSLRGTDPVTELDRARAVRQIRQWTASGKMPEQEALQKAVSTASSIDPNDFVDERAYQLEKIRTVSALTGLEALAERQKSDAERMVDAIEASSDAAVRAYEAQLAALDRAEESAAAWRERELARVDQQIAELGDWRDKQISALDAMLLEAQEQVGRLEDTWQATLNIKDALDQLNKLLVEGGAKPVTAPVTSPAPDLSGIATALQATAASSQAAAVATQTTTNETVALKAEIIALRKDLAVSGTAQVSALKSLDDRLRKWDMDGVPPGRDDDGATLVRAA